MLTLDTLAHTYRSRDRRRDHLALDGVKLTMSAGEMVCLVGPSGCGKTTLLRAVAGLLRPTGGTITLDGQPVTGVPDGVAMIAQNYANTLLPWRTTTANIAFGLRPQHLPRAERRERVAAALAAVGLADAGHKHPWQLSGGMQQRVAIARAIACRPRLLLADEPFASVDAQTRADLEDLLLRVQREHHMTVLLVTHDIDEAVYLGHRVAVLGPPPSSIIADLPIDLPADRDQISTRENPQFVALRTEVARLIRTSGQEATTRNAAAPQRTGA